VLARCNSERKVHQATTARPNDWLLPLTWLTCTSTSSFSRARALAQAEESRADELTGLIGAHDLQQDVDAGRECQKTRRRQAKRARGKNRNSLQAHSPRLLYNAAAPSDCTSLAMSSTWTTKRGECPWSTRRRSEVVDWSQVGTDRLCVRGGRWSAAAVPSDSVALQL